MAVLIPAHNAGDMPLETMEQLKQKAEDRARGQEIHWKGFGHSPHFWSVYYDIGNDLSTKSTNISRKSEAKDVQRP